MTASQPRPSAAPQLTGSSCADLLFLLSLQDIKAKINAVQQAVMKIGSSLSGQGGSGGSEDVQDAEVKDKKE